jgi:hypothetical protein
MANARVAVDADDENLAERSRLLENLNMTWVEQIEAAVGEDSLAAVAFSRAKPHNRLLQR